MIVVAGFIALLLKPDRGHSAASMVPRPRRRRRRSPPRARWCSSAWRGVRYRGQRITHWPTRARLQSPNAQHGRGGIGHLVTQVHIQDWCQRNTPTL